MLNSIPVPTIDQEAVNLSFHHVGCAVKSIDAALHYYTGIMGFERVSETVEVSSQQVRVCFVKLGEGILLELVEGMGEGSPVERRIESSGGGPYHICYEACDLDTTIQRLREKGFHRLKRFEMSVGERRLFAFMLTPDRQLLELCETPKE